MKEHINRRRFFKRAGYALATLPFVGALLAGTEKLPPKETSKQLSDTDKDFVEMDKKIMSVARSRNVMPAPRPGDQWIDTSKPGLRVLRVYDGKRWNLVQYSQNHNGFEWGLSEPMRFEK